MGRDLDHRRYQAEAGACALSSWQGAPERCRWCDERLPAGATATTEGFCGPRCLDDYAAQHCWDRAREVALARDDHRCRHCGRGPASVEEMKVLLRALVPMSAIEAARLWRSRDMAELREACAVEVNHISPRLGCGYHTGCHHHTDGLETLCHPCHVAVTNRQAAQRAVGGGTGGQEAS